MSELKAHKAYNRWIDEEMPTPNDDLICNEVYLKSEADKVIADLEEKHKTEVKELLCLIRDKENNFNRAFDSEEKEIRHNKYKRCMAMAWWCSSQVDHYHSEGYIYEHEGKKDELEDCLRRVEFYHRWFERWDKLANKFKQ